MKSQGKMPLNLFLIRHGQSEGNLARRQFEETGHELSFSEEFLNLHESQYALTPLGVYQAKLAGKWLYDNGFISFDRMLVSSNVRAMQTAAYLSLPNAIWMIDYNLRERDGGLFNVIPPSIRDVNYLEQQKFFDTQPFFFRPPQGESVADLCQRVKIILDTLARECNGKNVVIVCHGHVMRSFRIILERMSHSQATEFLMGKTEKSGVPNCSIIHYTRQNPEFPETEMASHLDWMRIIRPAGGGDAIDDFSLIQRRKYSNEELLQEAEINRKS